MSEVMFKIIGHTDDAQNDMSHLVIILFVYVLPPPVGLSKFSYHVVLLTLHRHRIKNEANIAARHIF